MTLISVLAVLAPAHAQAQSPEADEGPSKETVIRETLVSLRELIALELKKQAELEVKREESLVVEEASLQKEIQEEIAQISSDLSALTEQIEALTAGVTSAEFDPESDRKFDLQAELELLAQPFVVMLRSATHNARQIEKLRQLAQTADKNITVSQQVVDRVEPLLEFASAPATLERIQSLLATWRERLDSAESVKKTSETQLAARLQAVDAAPSTFSSFFAERAQVFFLGVGLFFLVFAGIRLISSWFFRSVAKRPIAQTLGFRLARLLLILISITLGFSAMFAVFNAYNDWLLLGLASILLVALVWVGLKVLPSLVEQITLLLNLGAVQEGERITQDGILWRVDTLDFYTILSNPALRSGTYTVPIRELLGKFSRPVAADEIWFPCKEGDVVVLEDDRWGIVLFQSPETVKLELEGGAALVIQTESFLGLNPKNLSRGFRIEIEFGLDYQHQALATTTIPETLKVAVRKGIEPLVGATNLRNVEVGLCRAGASSLDFEIEVDLQGEAAYLYEDIQHTLTRIAVDCCTENGWNIPFPQLTLHQAGSAT